MFSAKSFSEEGLRSVPIAARFLEFKLAFHGPLLWTLVLFCQAAVRCYDDTNCLLPVFPCVFLGYLFTLAPRYRPRVPDVRIV